MVYANGIIGLLKYPKKRAFMVLFCKNSISLRILVIKIRSSKE